MFGLSLHIFSPNSTLLCWFNLLVVRIRQVVVPSNWARKDVAHEVHLFGYTSRLPFSFPNSMLSLMVFGLLTDSVAWFWGAPRGDHLCTRRVFWPKSQLFQRAHPLPATPFQCPRSRTASLGPSILTLDWLYIEPSPCGGVRPAGDPVDSDPGARLPWSPP